MFTCSSGVKECLACCTADPQTMLDHQLEQAALLLHEFPDAQGSPEKSILLFTLLRREGVISIHYHLMCPQHTKKTALAAQSQSTTVCVANAARSPPCRGKVWALPWDRWARDIFASSSTLLLGPKGTLCPDPPQLCFLKGRDPSKI